MKKTILAFAAIAMLDANCMKPTSVESAAMPTAGATLAEIQAPQQATLAATNQQQAAVPAALKHLSFNTVEDLNKAGKCWTWAYNTLRAGQVVVNAASTALTGFAASQLMHAGDNFNPHKSGVLCLASAIANGVSVANSFFLLKITGRLEEIREELAGKVEESPMIVQP